MNYGDMVSKAKSEVIDDLAHIVADAQRQERIALLRAEIERVEGPRARALKDRDKFQKQFEGELMKLNKLTMRVNGFSASDERKRKAEKDADKQANKCQGIRRVYDRNKQTVDFIDRQLKEMRDELRKLEGVRIHKPRHLDLLREVLNGKSKTAR